MLNGCKLIHNNYDIIINWWLDYVDENVTFSVDTMFALKASKSILDIKARVILFFVLPTLPTQFFEN